MSNFSNWIRFEIELNFIFHNRENLKKNIYIQLIIIHKIEINKK